MSKFDLVIMFVKLALLDPNRASYKEKFESLASSLRVNGHLECCRRVVYLYNFTILCFIIKRPFCMS